MSPQLRLNRLGSVLLFLALALSFVARSIDAGYLDWILLALAGLCWLAALAVLVRRIQVGRRRASGSTG